MNTKMPFKSEEQNQLQLLDREEIDDEDDLFELMIDMTSAFAVTSHGINAGDVKKLKDAGIYTCNGPMMHTKKSLTGIKGLSEAKVDKICEVAEKIVNIGYITGSDVLLRRKAVIKITTGSQTLDELLGVTSNGINAGDVKKLQDANSDMNHTKTVTEIYNFNQDDLMTEDIFILDCHSDIFVLVGQLVDPKVKPNALIVGELTNYGSVGFHELGSNRFWCADLGPRACPSITASRTYADLKIKHGALLITPNSEVPVKKNIHFVVNMLVNSEVTFPRYPRSDPSQPRELQMYLKREMGRGVQNTLELNLTYANHLN